MSLHWLIRSIISGCLEERRQADVGVIRHIVRISSSFLFRRNLGRRQAVSRQAVSRQGGGC
jgi:hypothetical protein